MVNSAYSKTVVIIGGPSASGKSELALGLAALTDGVIINGDSQQIYHGLPILSTQPTPEEMSRVPHKLYGILDKEEKSTAATWRALALGEIQEAHAHNKLPIVVGGTGLYLKALYEGLHTIPPIPPEIRQRVLEIPWGNLHQELKTHDPIMAARLHPKDKQRLGRALEIILATGRSQASWIEEPLDPTPSDLAFFKILVMPPKEQNDAWAWKRTQKMFAQGVVHEVAECCKTHSNPPHHTIGFQPILDHLQGFKNLDQTVVEVYTKTRQYIKRQRTWFKGQYTPDLLLEEVSSPDSNQQILTQIKSYFPL